MDPATLATIVEAAEEAATERRGARDQVVVRLQPIAAIMSSCRDARGSAHVAWARARARPVLFRPLADDD